LQPSAWHSQNSSSAEAQTTQCALTFDPKIDLASQDLHSYLIKGLEN
jgi:hypothetical protein